MGLNTTFIKICFMVFSLFILSGCVPSKDAAVLSNELAIAQDCEQNTGDLKNDCYDLIAYKNSFAQLRLGVDAQNRGLFDEAKQRYDFALEQGNFYASSLMADLYNSGLGVKEDEDKAFGLLEDTKDVDPIAAYKISSFYFKKQNIEDGIKYLTFAAQNGVKLAQKELSTIYSNGEFIEADTRQSEFWGTKYQENSDDFMKKILGK